MAQGGWEMILINEEMFLDYLGYNFLLYKYEAFPKTEIGEQLYAQMIGWA